jgi:hypothetical protein
VIGDVQVWRVTKYDPADRDDRGYYIGTADTGSDHGVVEAAYLDTVAAFAESSGIDTLEIREPAVLAGTGPDEAHPFGDCHDGAVVALPDAVELVRAMLRGDGLWCRLEAGDDFFVHVGWDQYVYVGSRSDCSAAVAFAAGRGLFAEPLAASPYMFDDDDVEVRPADASFWADLSALVAQTGAVLLEEGYVHNRSRWHRLTPGNVQQVRTRLAPRSRLLVWPDLNDDVHAVLDSLPGDGPAEIVWEDHTGRMAGRLVEVSELPALRVHLVQARAATALSAYADERRPLLAAVLPDPDSVLRARWTP